MGQSCQKNLESHAKGVDEVMPDVSVVIPTYGRPDKLLQLLQRLEKQTFSDFEVVVIILFGSLLWKLDQLQKYLDDIRNDVYKIRRSYDD